MKPKLSILFTLLGSLGPVAGAQTLQSERIPLQLSCAGTLQDQGGPGCIPASSTPTLGALYPLSVDFCVDPVTGWVGLGTTNPIARLSVEGDAVVDGDLRFNGVADGIVFSSSNPGFETSVPMLSLFSSGSSNPDRTVIGHSPSFPNYGLAYRDSTDRFVFQTSPGNPVLEVDLNDQRVIVSGFLQATTGTTDSTLMGINKKAGNLTAGVEGHHTVGGTGVYGRADGVSGVGVWGAGADGVIGSATGGGYGVYSYGDSGASGTKTFVQPHPTDPAKEIRYVSLEGNEAGTYFRGTTRLVGGMAVIDVPEDFRLVTEETGLTVQVTPLGQVCLWIEERSLERIVVRGERDVEFDYFVNGVRYGYAGHEPIVENRMYVPRFRDEVFQPQLPEAVRELMVESGLLYPDHTPNETTAARLGWTLNDRPVRSDD